MTLLRDGIYEAVRADILACRLAPGRDMREEDLARRYRVSRAPVRDALLRLQREHLVTVVPRKGSRVNRVSVNDARDLFRLRLVLEPACVAAAARHAPDEVLGGLEAFRALEVGSDFIAYNRAFHAALAVASGNHRMAAVVVDLIDQSERLVRVSIAQIKGRDPAQLVTEHKALIEAVVARDGRTASRLARAHVAKAARRVLSALARSDATTPAPRAITTNLGSMP